jgi:predicted permease
MTSKFIIFLVTIYGCLIAGYGSRFAFKRLQEKSRLLTRVFIIFLTPLITLNAFWSVELRGVQLLTMPLISVGVQALALLPGFLIAKFMHLNGREKGSFIACAMFSNTGPTLGVFLCFILFGDQGLYLASWFITLYLPFYYFVGFPMMSSISGEAEYRIVDALRDLISNPVSIVPISSMTLGLVLNLAGVARPESLNLFVTKFLTYLLTASFSFAIGLGLNFRKSFSYVKHSLWISCIKFVYNPLVSLLIMWALGYFQMSYRLPLKVVFVESFMPTAILAVVLSKIFRLNEDLANAAWILSTLIIVPIIPFIFFIQSVL